jgi:hypothetical protein
LDVNTKTYGVGEVISNLPVDVCEDLFKSKLNNQQIRINYQNHIVDPEPLDEFEPEDEELDGD